ncbi:filamentous hemagglutinin family N-terminal domain protein [Opitutaceae bacterium TAV1]|nr:filamentous hemagglutinin family N-terminal domain protein [Opitutaceae bacterium TAV1]
MNSGFRHTILRWRGLLARLVARASCPCHGAPRRHLPTLRRRPSALHQALAFLLAVLMPFPAGARNILSRGGSSSAPPAAGATAPSAATVAEAQAALLAARAANSRNILSRNSDAIQAVRAAQAAARAAAQNAASTLPDGLKPGGLVVAPGATPGSALWSGALAPVESSSAATGNTLVTVEQTESKAILTWENFNVGKNTTLYFDQTAGGSDAPQWIALNRVEDPTSSPTQILGRIKAEGQVYVINKNGVIFGGSSQVNVHTLVASSLDFRGATTAERNETFRQGIAFDDQRLNTFAVDPAGAPGAPRTGVVIQGGARIVTDESGSIYLVGQDVTNAGELSAPGGQVVMAAGDRVWISKNWLGSGHNADYTDPDLRGVRATVSGGGTATNTGLVTTDRGNITVTGKSIHQAGVLAATTSVTANGSVTLLAGDAAASSSLYWMWPTSFGDITLAPGSLIAITPDDDTTTGMAAQYRPSRIEILGQTILMEADARIHAPSATVNFVARTNSATASAANDPSFIYIDDGAEIDLAGLSGVEVAMERNSITGELRLDELKDAPLQREGALRGKTVSVDLRRGTTLADFSGYYGLIENTAPELMTTGGTLKLDSGTVVTRAGSRIDLSGGSLRYLDGYVETTRLRGADGHIYDISTASPDIVYTGIYETSRRFEKGYTEGKSAGTLILGPQPGYGNTVDVAGNFGQSVRPYFVALEGAIDAGVTVGAYQREKYTAGASPQEAWKQLPEAATLLIGYTNTAGRSVGPNITIGTPAELPADLTHETLSTAFDPAGAHAIVLSAGLFDGQTFGTVDITSGIGGGDLVIAEGVTVDLGAFGSFRFTGSHAQIDGSILAPGGSVSILTDVAKGYYETSTTPVNWTTLGDDERPWIRLGSGAVIDVSGLWINERLDGFAASSTPLALDGGSVSLRTVSDLVLDSGSVIDVSGGGRLTAAGKLAAGDAGSILLENDIRPDANKGFSNVPSGQFGRFDVLGADLRGFALGGTGGNDGKGGSLSLGASRSVTITGEPPPETGTGAADTLYLTPDFFRQGGFASYAVGAGGDLTVTAGTVIEPQALSRIASGALWSLPTGGDAGSVLAVGFLHSDLRQPMSLTLSNGLRTASGDFAADTVNPGSSDAIRGNLTFATGAQLLMDPQSAIALHSTGQVFVDGTLSTPGGSIDVSTLAQSSGAGITLGENARLLAPGFVKTTPAVGAVSVRSVEAAGNVSLSVSGAQQSYLFTDPGSLIDVSGIMGTADLIRTSTTIVGKRAVYEAREVGGNAGSVTLEGARGGVVAGQIEAAPGGPAAAGGSILVSAGQLRTTPLTGLLLTDDETVLSFDPANPSAWTGTVTVYAPALRESGADSFAFRSPRSVAFDGDFSFTARRSLAFATPLLGIASGAAEDAVIELTAPYVSFGAFPGVGDTGNPPPGVPSAPPSLAGGLIVTASLIDIVQTLDLGGNGLGGFADARFVSTGDIRLTVGSGPVYFVGRLQSPGALTFESAQTWVTTASRVRAATDNGFLIQSGRSVTFAGNGNAAPVPYSYGETLTVRAPEIVQGGVVRAPQGRINLQATDSLVLAPGSLTSVSLEGAIIPVGAAIGGEIEPWIEAGVVPEKAITLGGPEVDVQSGAVVDVSGGGDLYGWEFIAGNGGSRDLLSTAGMFAIIPGYNSPAAPVYANTTATGSLAAGSLRAGDSVWLSGVAGLPDGFYTLLPAHYALLPGGMAIQALSGGFASLPAAGATLADGSQIVSGYRAVAGTPVHDASLTQFRVMSQEVLRDYSSYTDISFNDYATGLAARAGIVAPRLPLDAGTLTLAATSSLRLDGEGRFGAPEGGLLGNVDIAALRIAMLGDGQSAPDDSYLALSATEFSNFGVGSLLLGGTRSQAADGTQINVSATSIYVSNDAASALVLPELILASRDTITIADGSVIRAEGATSGATAPLLLAGNGALLRASTGDRIGINRTGTSTAAGQLAIGADVTLAATGSLSLDGTRSVTTTPTTLLDTPQLDLSSSQVSIGDAPDGTGGLVLSGASVEALGRARSLLVRSHGTIDFFGDVTIGSRDADGEAALRTLIFDAAGLNGQGAAGDTVSVTAGEFELRNTFNVASTVPAPGEGTLRIDAEQWTLGPGASAVQGFAGVSVSADQVTASGTGSLAVDGALDIATDLLTAGKASDYRIAATGAVAVTQGRGSEQTPAASGGRLEVRGASVALDTTVSLPAGIFEARATAGDLVLGENARLLARGVTTHFYDTAATTPGGTLRLTADAGDITAVAGSLLDVSGNAGNADSGRIEISATNGRADLRGTLADATGGSFALDAATLADFSALNAALNRSGFTGERDIRLRDQSLALGAGETLAAGDVRLRSDTGSVTVEGAIEATGSIRLTGGDGVTVSGTLAGSSVELTATGGELALDAGSLVRATDGGSVILTARRDGDDIAIARLEGAVEAGEFVVRGERTYDYTATGVINAGDFATMLDDASVWMTGSADAIHTRLGSVTPFELQAAIRAASDGDLAVNGDLDLHTRRYGADAATPGALALSAGGNLSLNGSISDGFSTASASTGTLLDGRSWSYAFESGGDITLAAGKLVRTGTGDITLDAGRDLILKDTRSVIYTAGQKIADADGFNRGSRVGEYPVNGGDIRITAGRDIVAPLTQDFISGWLYRYGYASTTGGVSLADMSVASQTSWSVVFANYEQGIGALGGGDITIDAGRHIRDLAVALPTTGQMTTAVGQSAGFADIVVRGGGDLRLHAGGDIYGGVYMLGRGEAEVVADGAITSGTQSYQRRDITVSSTAISNYVLRDLHALFALMDASLTVRARGDVEIEAILDPMLVPSIAANITGNGTTTLNRLNTFFNSYTDRTSADIVSTGGDVEYYNNPWAAADLARGNTARAIDQQMSVPSASNPGEVIIPRDLLYVPGTMRLAALQGDISLLQYFNNPQTNHAFRLAPSATGTLDLLAGGEITSDTPIIMMDVATEYLRTALAPFRNNTRTNLRLPTADTLGVATNYGRGDTPLHLGDTTPAHIYALAGSIAGASELDTEKLKIYLPKAARIAAGEDIANLTLSTQHNQATDITLVRAGRDIVVPDIRVLGQGELVVEAGRDIDMKSIYSTGLWTTGNLGSLATTNAVMTSGATRADIANLALRNEGADITILAGAAAGADYEKFIATYLDPANAAGVVRTYLPELRAWMETLGLAAGPDGSALDDAALVSAFSGLPQETRQPLLLDIYFTELKETGIDATNPDSPRFGSYQRGYLAVSTLFADPEESPRGNINFYGNPVLTQAGGDIDILVPYGDVRIDEVSHVAGGSVGVITQKGGQVRMMTDGDIALGNSRVFTLQGGDLLMWTSHGDITAGAGSKTRATPPALRYVVDNDGNSLLNATALQTGSGIGVLDAGDAAGARSRLDLIAPEGTVDAGDAGIRAAGDINIAALHVIGADNISAGGVATGVPTAVSPNMAALAAVNAAAGSLASAADETSRSQRPAPGAGEDIPSLITVEVLGYGEGGEPEKDDRVSGGSRELDVARASRPPEAEHGIRSVM